jgi:NADP-dependent 3-hydroxy acid dehydrogenase YdfG
MSSDKTIVVAGYGSGISDAVASRFGREGFKVALVARDATKLEQAAKSFRERGIEAAGFACQLGDITAVKGMIDQVRSQLGPVTVVHWNAASGLGGDLAVSDPAQLRTVFDVGAIGLVAAVQAALPDLREQDQAAVLITGGGFAQNIPEVDGFLAQIGAMGLGLGKAVQHKLAGLLHARLAKEGIYVGEVMVTASVKGTSFDAGDATLEAGTIADKFWDIYQGRDDIWVTIG